MNTEVSGGLEEKFASFLRQLEMKHQEQMQEQQRKIQQMEEMVERCEKMEEFLSKVVDLLARHSPSANNPSNPPFPSGAPEEKDGGVQEEVIDLRLEEKKQINEQQKQQQQMEEELQTFKEQLTKQKREQQLMVKRIAEMEEMLLSSTTALPAERGATSSSPAPRSLLEAAERGDAQSLRQMLAEERGENIREELERCLLAACNADAVGALINDARLSLNQRLGERAIIEAASNGRVSALEALLQARVNYSAALCRAAEKGHAAILQVLLCAGCNPNVKDNIGSFALHLAACRGYDKCVRLLLDAGADVTVTDSQQSTPLHSAAAAGATQCARLLLDAGADINASSSNGSTPLKMASRNRQHNTAEFLRKRGGR